MSEEEGAAREEATEEQIAEVVSKWTGIPVSKLVETEREKFYTFRYSFQKSDWSERSNHLQFQKRLFVHVPDLKMRTDQLEVLFS